MTATLLLVAVPGRSLPREDMRSRMIDGTDAAPSPVPSTTYYRRALARGDVREASAAPAKSSSKSPKAPTPAIEVAVDIDTDQEA